MKEEYDRKLKELKLELQETTSLLEARMNDGKKPIFIINTQKIGEDHTEYNIQTLFRDGRNYTTVKRYSGFVIFRKRLIELTSRNHSILTIPNLPPKHFSRKKSMSTRVVEERRKKFIDFLNIMVRYVLLSGDVEENVKDCFWEWLGVVQQV